MATASSRSLPRYRRIAAALEHEIEQGIYPPGSMLPSEADLAARFGVTRMTVRQALAGLAAQRLIERRHGHGTIVVPIQLQRQPLRPIGLADELEARGLRPGSRILALEEMRPAPAVRKLLWIGPRGTVVRVRRLRTADDLLIGLQETLIPSRLVPGMLDLDLTDQSLARMLRLRHGLVAAWDELTIEAVVADGETSVVLDVAPGSPLLRSTSVTFLDDGRPLERTIGWFPGTRYSYRLRRGVAPDA
jgi:GntR family transcriptional regulator